jgi:hypothetical protein
MGGRPIRLVLSDDLERSRLTVFFRLLLALPHLVWLALWTIVAWLAAIASWVATLIAGRTPDGLHAFLARYVRYSAHVNAYLHLIANPFPGFTGEPGSYPVDVEIDPPAEQNRWITGFRLILGLPALSLVGVLAAGGGTRYSASVLVVAGVLLWFACLALARAPRGLRDAGAYGIAYQVQVGGYLFFLTDRYPNSDPLITPAAEPAPPHPVRLDNDDDLVRNRLTVFFRLLLALPHLVWLTLWGVLATLAIIANWVATLIAGRSPDALHNFIARYLRYSIHVTAYLLLTANPFPGFVGAPSSYPIELEIDPPAEQNRWKTGFRIFLLVPAAMLNSALGGAQLVAAVLGWWAALFTGRMPQGLRNLGAYALRYTGQTNAYAYLLTDRYPYGGPGPVARAAAPAPPPPAVPPAPAAAPE